MRKRQAGLLVLVLLMGIAFLSCRPTPPKMDWSTRDEIPPDQLSSVMDAHYRGLGAMERYEYAQAAEAFREVHRLAPGWNAGTINLSIALLNQGGEAEARLKAAGQTELTGEASSNIDESIRLLGIVISRLPDNPWAHFSRGIIFENQGKIQEAHLDFKKVIEVDPSMPKRLRKLEKLREHHDRSRGKQYLARVEVVAQADRLLLEGVGTQPLSDHRDVQAIQSLRLLAGPSPAD